MPSLFFPLVELLGMMPSLLLFVGNYWMTEREFELILLLLLNYFDIVSLVHEFKRNRHFMINHLQFVVQVLLFFLFFNVSLSVATTVVSGSEFFSGKHVNIQLPFVF